VAELSLQKPVYGSESGECKRGCSSFQTIWKFTPPVSASKHYSGQKSQTWSEKYEQTSNFIVAELSLQKSVCRSASGESKKGCSSFWSSIIFSHRCYLENAKVGKRDRPRLKNRKKIETSTEQSSLYRCLFAAPSVRNQRGDKGVLDSSGSLPVLTMCDSTRRW